MKCIMEAWSWVKLTAPETCQNSVSYGGILDNEKTSDVDLCKLSVWTEYSL